MGVAHQLKMFGPSQHECAVCGEKFVPFSRDMVWIWHNQLDLEPDWLTPAKWAVDCIYREMQFTCSAGHATLYENAKRARLVQEMWERASRRYR